MLVGIGVTHPAPQSMKGTPSIAGVVASIDAVFGQFPGSLLCQTSKMEMVEKLDDMMTERLNLWIANNNGRKPKKIMFYRDGKQIEDLFYESVLIWSVQVYRIASTGKS